MPSLSVPGAELHYDSAGSGPPLVLVHGSATDSTTWTPVVNDLAAHHRVITYDRRGYGRCTQDPVRDHRIHADDLRALLTRVVGEPAHVVGWSAGGNVALATAVNHPALFSGLCIVEAPFHGIRHADRGVMSVALRLKLLQALGRRTGAAEVFLRWASGLRSGGNSFDRLEPDLREGLLAYADNILAEWDPHPYGIMVEHVSAAAVADLDIPITWVLGSESLPWLHGLQARVADARPDMVTVVVPGAGHLVHHDAPQEFVRAVRSTVSAA
ncbi:alpha/beta hydrolase [Gordonia sp. CPCC 205515]|uniref:alpha/beta fold hydrolase n=1 Tax=Gordonia sp. CPCC 205515 TaxID=3140791 RepID=UPI003AF382ED